MSIVNFFRGKVLLITGGTAFLGQPMVAKILTSLPDVGKIYLLIRGRTDSTGKRTSAQERLDNELLTSDVFAVLRRTHGDKFDDWARQKITAVEGELTDEHLGFSNELYQQLQNEVQIFINIAGLVQFDPPFDESLRGNALAAKHVVTFAKGCQNAVFLHVSTAYVCGDNPGPVPETLHLPYERYAQQHLEKTGNAIPQTLTEEIDALLARSDTIRAEANTPERLAQFEQQAQQNTQGSRKRTDAVIKKAQTDWLEARLVEAGLSHARSRGWNDTYTYMKFLAEQMIMELRGELPTAIIRPSIIESSFAEPVAGWLGKFRMSEPLIVGFAKGRLPDFPADPDIILDIIPVDFVVNAILAAAEATARHGDIEVYHVATGTQNPLYFRGIVDATYDYFVKYPMLDADKNGGKPIQVPVWQYPSLEEFQRKLDGRMRLLDLAIQALARLPLRSAKRRRRKLVLKQSNIKALLHYIRIYAPYTRTNFEFETRKMQALYETLSPAEQQRFNFDVSQIHWKQYFHEIHIPGIKRHVLKLEESESSSATESKQSMADSEDEAEASTGRKAESGAITSPLKGDAENPIDCISPKTIVDLVKMQAQRIPDKTALEMLKDGKWEQYTYAETYTCSRHIAFQLWESGLRKGDRAVLVSENQPAWCIAYLAAVQIGVAVVPLDAQTPAQEILAIAEFTQAKSILVSENVLALRGDALTKTNRRLQNINEMLAELGTPALQSTTSHDFPNVTVSPDTVASIIFTMGTTVDATGAMLTHGGFISNVRAVAKALPPTNTERILSALPLYHALSFSCSLLMAFYSGTTAIYVNALKPTTLLKTMREAKITAFIGVPRLYQMLQNTIERQAARDKNVDKPLAEKAKTIMGGDIRVLVSGGASLSDEVYDGFEKLGLTLYQGYGMTETAPVLSVNPYLKSKRGSVGPAVEGVELRIENPDSHGIGEIIAKGPSTMKGYYQNPAATDKTLRDGWLYTGDLGYMDADGYLYITGHCKDIIVPTTGKNVYPVELEALYQNHPAISEICVVGIPDNDGTDTAIHAVVVPAPLAGTNDMQQGDATTEADILKYLQTRAKELPSYQQFHKIHFWKTGLPKTSDNVIDRQGVKTVLQAQLAAEVQSTPKSNQIRRTQNVAHSEIPEEILLPLARLARMPADQILPKSGLDTDLGLDSLMKLDLLLLLEGRVGQTIPDAMLANLQTVGDVVGLIQNFDAIATAENPGVDRTVFDGDAAATEIRQVPPWYSRAFRAVISSIYKHYFSLECHGLEHIPHGQPYIITPNHTSHLDTLTVITALGPKAYQLWTLAARDYWFANRLQGWFAQNCLNALPIEREGNFTEFLQDLRIANEVMEQNNGLLIFPEGTRSVNGNLQPFKPGILSLLIYGPNVPIIPAYIEGTYDALPKGRNFPKKHPVRIVFGEPLTFDMQSGDVLMEPDRYQDFLELAQNRVAELAETLSKRS